jgi:hypothetical protein
MIEGGGLFSWLLPCVLVSWIDGLIVGGGCFRMAMCGVLLQRISSPVWVRLSPNVWPSPCSPYELLVLAGWSGIPSW